MTTHQLELTPLIDARSTAYLATELALLTESDTVNAHYHDIIDTLCRRHSEVDAAWERWADDNGQRPARDRVLAGNVILPVVQTLLTAHPDLAFSTAARYDDADGDTWEFRCGQWGYRSSDGEWCSYLNSISSINRLFGPLTEL